MDTKMYVDAGYNEDTHVTFVKPRAGQRDQVTFETIERRTTFDDLIGKLCLLALKHEVFQENVYVPKQPAIEHALKQAKN